MQPGLGILLVADAPLPAATLHETLDVADSLSQLPCDMMGREIQSRGLQSDVRRYGAGPRNTTSLTATLKYSTGRELPSVSCASPRGCENRTTLDALERIGSVMLTTGRLVAGLCDSFLDLSSGQLERSIALSGVAKARLVHYHAQATDPTSGETKPSERAAAADLRGLGSWQGWHCDYGLFTVLCSPRYRSRVPVDSTKDGAPAVVDAAPPPSAGLVLLSPGQPSLGTSPIPVVVHVPPGMLAVQVGWCEASASTCCCPRHPGGLPAAPCRSARLRRCFRAAASSPPRTASPVPLQLRRETGVRVGPWWRHRTTLGSSVQRSFSSSSRRGETRWPPCCRMHAWARRDHQRPSAMQQGKRAQREGAWSAASASVAGLQSAASLLQWCRQWKRLRAPSKLWMGEWLLS